MPLTNRSRRGSHMNSRRIVGCFSHSARSSAGARPAGQRAATTNESTFLSRVRRLTVEGRRAGEGYWSPDGKRLVFQSEREPGNPFYQIYVLDLAHRRRQAHLARHRQDDVRVLPAGQRRDPLLVDARRSEVEAVAGRGARVPRVGQGAPLLVGLRPRDGHLRVQREDRRAEAADRPRAATTPKPAIRPTASGSRSRRCATSYGRALTDAEKKQLEIDPSYFAEIYIMRADGSGQKRLTTRRRLRRRAVLHARRLAHRLAPVRRAGADRRRLDDEARWLGRRSRSPTSAR